MINFNPETYRSYIVNRRRYIPNESISLHKDTIYYVSEDLIVTGWRAITKRADFSGGMSAYFPKHGIKTSKLFNANNKLLYWYNDIGEVFFEGTTIQFNDLLLDIVVFPDNSVTYMDIDEFADAIEANLITKEQQLKALRSYDFLVKLIHKGEYHTLMSPIQQLEEFLNLQSL